MLDINEYNIGKLIDAQCALEDARTGTQPVSALLLLALAVDYLGKKNKKFSLQASRLIDLADYKLVLVVNDEHGETTVELMKDTTPESVVPPPPMLRGH
jgi:hypothetical protein